MLEDGRKSEPITYQVSILFSFYHCKGFSFEIFDRLSIVSSTFLRNQLENNSHTISIVHIKSII